MEMMTGTKESPTKKMLYIHFPGATIVGNNSPAIPGRFPQVWTEPERGSMLRSLGGAGSTFWDLLTLFFFAGGRGDGLRWGWWGTEREGNRWSGEGVRALT